MIESAGLAGFNPRARAGRDRRPHREGLRCHQFQSTRPRGARRASPPGRVSKTTLFQSTRPRGARPTFAEFDDRKRPVSIHAPARGATWWHGRDSCLLLGFNPRARAGRDWTTSANTSSPSSFNPRARAGRDVIVIAYKRGNGWFQSTRPRGARHHLREQPDGRAGRFNPRARAGRDLVERWRRDRRPRFQSTRPRGARLSYAANMADVDQVSIHAPARGATCSCGTFL